MDIFRAILDGIAMAGIFNGAAATVVLINPRYFFDSYPKAIQKATPKQMTKEEKHVNFIFTIVVMGICAAYEIISNMHTGITGFWPLFWTGYINWNIVNFGDFFLLDCLLFQGKYKGRIVIPGTEGHPDYEFGNWMKHLGLLEHFLLWPFILVPIYSAVQAGIIMLVRVVL